MNPLVTVNKHTSYCQGIVVFCAGFNASHRTGLRPVLTYVAPLGLLNWVQPLFSIPRTGYGMVKCYATIISTL